MNNKKTGAFNLGGRGFLMVILSFLSCYMYSALTSDMINVMPDAYAGIYQIDANAIVIMCSAMGQQAMVIEAIQSGAKDFIVKPFQAERVLEAVKKVVG